MLFWPNRAEPDQVFDEFRDRNRHRSFRITLKQSFGGSGGAKVAAKGIAAGWRRLRTPLRRANFVP